MTSSAESIDAESVSTLTLAVNVLDFLTTSIVTPGKRVFKLDSNVDTLKVLLSNLLIKSRMAAMVPGSLSETLAATPTRPRTKPLLLPLPLSLIAD